MVKLGPCIKVSLIWIPVLFAETVRKDICERCMKIEQCPSFAHLNKHEQQEWLEKVPCSDEKSNFGFSPNAKEDNVCCPQSNIWENENANSGYDSGTNRHNNNIRLGNSHQSESLSQNFDPNQNYYRYLQPQTGDQNIYDIAQEIPINQDLYSNLQYERNNKNIYKPNNYKDNSPLHDTQNHNIYGYQQTGLWNQWMYGGQKKNSVERKDRQNPYRNVQNGIYNQNVNVRNPDYHKYQTTGINIWNIPRQPGINTGIQNSWQNAVTYPQQQNPYNQNGNIDDFERTDTDDKMCKVQTSLLPDPKTKCCGQDMSNGERITDLQNLLNIYATSNRRLWKLHNQPYQLEPSYQQKRKARAVNDTVNITLENRIAGGKETELDQFPWTALLNSELVYGNKQITLNCGGSLISNRYVLTAGHCVFEPGAKLTGVKVILAEYDKRTFPRDCVSEMGKKPKCIANVLIQAEEVILHPLYNDDQLLNDIALVRLQEYAPYTRYIKPICLTPINVDANDFANLPVAVAGWGRNGQYATDIKQSTVMRLIPRKECQISYPYLSNSHLCAAGRTGEDTCKGDSGGPLMMLFRGSYYVIGVVSAKRADTACGSSVPSLYTNVFRYIPWIMDNMRN